MATVAEHCGARPRERAAISASSSRALQDRACSEHALAGTHVRLFPCLSACLAVIAVLCSHVAAAELANRSENENDTDRLYNDITPAQFAKREDIQEAIDPRHFKSGLLAAAIFHRTNAVRLERNLPTLRYNRKVADAAQKHAEAMARGKNLSHRAPGKETTLSPYARLEKEGLQPQYSAENIAFNFVLRYEGSKPVFVREARDGRIVYSYEPQGKALEPQTYAGFARAIVQQWIDSPPHRKTLFSRKPTQLGVGCALSSSAGELDKIYCDQHFFAPVPRGKPHSIRNESNARSHDLNVIAVPLPHSCST